ncbi:hypothetical protein METHPM2_130056 [Pseudomonas sp. PM2]
MPWRSEISARDTGPVCACKAKSSMAVTAYRPFVVSLMDKYQGVSEWEQVCDSRVFKSTIRPSTLVRITRKKGARIIAGWGGIEQRNQACCKTTEPIEIKCGSWLACDSGPSACL